MTIAPCGRTDPHEHHVWTPEPRAIHGPKRCPGVVARIPAGEWGRLVQSTIDAERRAVLAERRAEEAEFHVEQLRDARDNAERRVERAEAEVERLRDALLQVRRAFDLQCPPMPPDKYVDRGAWMAHSWWNTVLGDILNRANDDSDMVLCPCGEPIGRADNCDSCCGCGAADQHELMATVEHLRRCPICDMRFDEPCDHDWLDRPESDTHECLICGVEVSG